MSVDVAPEIVINRPRTEVAAFMFEPKFDVLWTTGIVDCKPLTDGRLRTGSRVERVSKFLGRRFSYLVDVTDHGEDRFVLMKVTQPFPMEIRYELEDVSGGTLARIRAKGDATGFFRLAGPFMSRMVRKSIGADLAKLKECIEERAPAT